MGRKRAAWNEVLEWASSPYKIDDGRPDAPYPYGIPDAYRYAFPTVHSALESRFGVDLDGVRKQAYAWPVNGSDPPPEAFQFLVATYDLLLTERRTDSILPGGVGPTEAVSRTRAAIQADEAPMAIVNVARETAESLLGPIVKPVRSAFLYLAAGVAATARDLPSLRKINTPRLTFANVFGLLDALLAMPSGGAHQQYIFAALLEAYLQQLGQPGVVETKNINASDASAGTAADVQHKQGGQVIEAYELTANDWRTKIHPARATLAARDLSRIHVLGSLVQQDSGDQVANDLPADADVSVLDVREEVRSLVARLDKFHRRAALVRLYSLLVEKQSDDALVRGYVDALAARGLTETS